MNKSDLTIAQLRQQIRDLQGKPGKSNVTISSSGSSTTALASSFTSTTADFIQPGPGSTVDVNVLDTSWMAVGQTLFIQTGGYYTVVSVASGTKVKVRDTGDTGNPSLGFTVVSGSTVTAGGVQGATGSKGDKGDTGNTGPTGSAGADAYTTTTQNFTQPSVGSTVDVFVGSTAWMVAGEILYMATGGYYSVDSITNPTKVKLKNLGYTGNAAPATTVTQPKGVTPSGIQGATGSTGATGDTGATGATGAAGVPWSVQDTITAHSGGGGSGSAVELTGTWCRISTCAAHLDSVILPSMTAGQPYTVHNNGAKDAAIYPPSGGQIDALGTNAYYVLASGSTQVFVATSSSQCYRQNKALRYVDRGSVASEDWTQAAGLTEDSAYHSLSMTSIIPPSAYGKQIRLRLRITDGTSGKTFFVGTSSSMGYNLGQTGIIISGSASMSIIADITCTSVGAVYYSITTGTTGSSMVVQGWWVEG